MTDQQVVLITGAASGVGRLTALALARAGHVVYASMRDIVSHNKQQSEEIAQIASEENLTLHALELDVRSEASARAAVDVILSRHGRIDVVMNNAAMMMHGLTEAFRPEQIAEIIDLNAISWVRVNRAALPAMRRAGRGLLIYTGSGISRLPDPFTGPYAASKAAGDVLAEVMSLEVSRYGIETVIVQPGAYTSGTNHFMHAVGPADIEVVSQYDRLGGLSDELAERLNSTNLPDRRHDVDEVAEAIRDIVAMDPGTRPRRVDIDPQGRDVEQINEITAKLQRAYFKRLGIEDLLSVPANNK